MRVWDWCGYVFILFTAAYTHYSWRKRSTKCTSYCQSRCLFVRLQQEVVKSFVIWNHGVDGIKIKASDNTSLSRSNNAVEHESVDQRGQVHDYSWGIQAENLPKYPVLLLFKQQLLHFIWSCLTLDPNTLLKLIVLQQLNCEHSGFPFFCGEENHWQTAWSKDSDDSELSVQSTGCPTVIHNRYSKQSDGPIPETHINAAERRLHLHVWMSHSFYRDLPSEGVFRGQFKIKLREVRRGSSMSHRGRFSAS